MTHQEAVAAFSSLQREKQLAFLALFGNRITVAARNTYEVGTDRVLRPEDLRKANEIMHRVFGQIARLASDSADRFPDEVIVSIMFEHDTEFWRSQSEWAFIGALKDVMDS